MTVEVPVDLVVEKTVRAAGFGSWVGDDPTEAARVVFGELGSAPGVPYLPLLPERGPGADPIGRSLGLLVDLPVDLQPSGWRLVDRPGRDLQRARSFLVSDTDALAEIADGYRGTLTFSAVGPWTLAGSVWLPRGERVANDPGAARDLAASLTEGLRAQLLGLRRLVPGAELRLLVDEPGLPAALAGRLPTLSGFGRLRPIEAGVVQETLTELVRGVQGEAAEVVLRCTPVGAPWPMLRKTGPRGLGVDLDTLTPRAWEGVALGVEAGMRVALGVLDPRVERLPEVTALVARVRSRWREVGLPSSELTALDLAPTLGLAEVGAERGKQVLRRLAETARALTEVAQQ